MYASVLDKEGAFTEQKSSVNSFVIAKSNNSCNLKTKLSTETKRFFKPPMDKQHDHLQHLMIGAFIISV